MRNIIGLAKLAKEIFRTANVLIATVVRIKRNANKAKTLYEVKNSIRLEEDTFNVIYYNLGESIDNLIFWAHNEDEKIIDDYKKDK